MYVVYAYILFSVSGKFLTIGSLTVVLTSFIGFLCFLLESGDHTHIQTLGQRGKKGPSQKHLVVF